MCNEKGPTCQKISGSVEETTITHDGHLLSTQNLGVSCRISPLSTSWRFRRRKGRGRSNGKTWRLDNGRPRLASGAVCFGDEPSSMSSQGTTNASASHGELMVRSKHGSRNR